MHVSHMLETMSGAHAVEAVFFVCLLAVQQFRSITIMPAAGGEGRGGYTRMLEKSENDNFGARGLIHGQGIIHG